ncbi:hypothetical protein [Archangium lansingense]|uniref:Tetratricopeptide repeat protein n=1 Tax=Archangium lansingense TaxID=2995310 RepID=A0ABT3ZW43_9BACT|nr:hypothetical protein [Archangium lansinium]MCY1073311.1 hypothetical protein [Archangium lansinium]
MSSSRNVSIEELLRSAEEREDSGDALGAEALLGRVISLRPEFSLAWYRRGMLRLFEQAAFEEALADLSRAEELGVDQVGIPGSQLHYLLGECLFGLERFEEADARLQRGLVGEQDEVLRAEIYYRRAECAEVLARPEALREALTGFLAHKAAFLDSGGDEEQVQRAETRLAALSSGP